MVTARELRSPLAISERERDRAPSTDATTAQPETTRARIRQRLPNWGIGFSGQRDGKPVAALGGIIANIVESSGRGDEAGLLLALVLGRALCKQRVSFEHPLLHLALDHD